MSTPLNSAEVAIKLYDKARQLGIPVKIESSLVANSDSRYVILYPHDTNQAVIRISSHPPFEKSRYDLSLDAQRPSRRNSAVALGTKWIEDYAAHHSQIKKAIPGSPSAEISDAGVSGNGRPLGRKPNGWKRRNRYGAYRPVGGNSRGLRNSGAFPKRYGIKGYLRNELAGDD
jgi:hypothetical protein